MVNSWTYEKLGELAISEKGKNPKTTYSERKNGLMPYINIKAFEQGIFDEYTDGKGCNLCEDGDLLIVWDGSRSGLVGRAYKGAIGSTIAKIDIPLIEKDFLYYFLQSKYLQINTRAKGTGTPHVDPDLLWNYDFPIVPLPEQQRIVSKIEEHFSDLENAIEGLKKAQDQLKIYRQAVLKYAFEGKFNYKISNGELPKGWLRYKLKDIVIDKVGLRRGPFGSSIKKSMFVKKGYKIYEQGNAINDDPYRGTYFINRKKYNEMKGFRIAPGDLIVSCSGVTLGRICELPHDAKPGIINQALLRIRLNKNIISNSYFIRQFRSGAFQRKIFDQSQGTAMPNLVGIKDFKEIELILPPPKEQQNVVQEIDSRLSVCDNLEQSITKELLQAEALRQSILRQAFEGKLVPQNPKDPPASELLKQIKAEKELRLKEIAEAKAKQRAAKHHKKKSKTFKTVSVKRAKIDKPKKKRK